MVIAKAAVLLKFISENGHADCDDLPSAECLEVARQLMLANGYQLEYDEGDEGAPAYYNPPLDLKEHVQRMLLVEDYALRYVVGRCISTPLHGPMGESIGR
jgi:hypothetical protein